MSVIVKNGSVYDGERTYLPGEIITGLSEADAKSLVKSGAAEYVGGYAGTSSEPGEPPARGNTDADNDAGGDKKDDNEVPDQDPNEDKEADGGGPEIIIPGLEEAPKTTRKK